jgi:hypothetical protein
MPKATEDEIQRAHDILHAAVSGELRHVRLGKITHASLHSAHDVLGWILGYEGCGETFLDNLAKVEAVIARAGYVLEEKQT